MSFLRTLCYVPIVAVLLHFIVGCGSDGKSTGPDESRPRIRGNLFTADTAIVAGRSPWALAAADFTGNGFPDVAVADIQGSAVFVLANSGDESLFHAGAPTTYLDTAFVDTVEYFHPRAIATSDVNADGLPDLVVAMNLADPPDRDRIVVLLNTGSGAYTTPLDTVIAGGQLRDLFIGAADSDAENVSIIAAPSVSSEPILILERPTAQSASIPAQADDVSPLSVDGSAPANNDTDVSTASEIEVWFNAPVANQGRALLDSGWVTISGTIPGIGTRDIGIYAVRAVTDPRPSMTARYSITPRQYFLPLEEITVTLTGVRGVAGVGQNTVHFLLPEPKVIQFATTKLRVISSQPEPDEEFVGLDDGIVLAFNGPIDSTTANESTTAISGTGGRTIPFALNYDESEQTLRLDPSVPFQPYERITVSATSAIKDTLGRSVFDGHSFSFRATGPRVVSNTPRDGAVGSPNLITISFNTSMTPSTPGAFRVYGSQSGLHSIANVSLSLTSTRTLEVVPSGVFHAGETVTVVVTADVRSEEDAPLAKPHVWSFVAQPSAPAELRPVTPQFVPEHGGGTIAAGRYSVDGGGMVLADTSGVITAFRHANGDWVVDESLPVEKVRRVLRGADLNGNGLLDLIEVLADSDLVRVYLNLSDVNGAIAFGAADEYQVGRFPAGVFIGDLDGDGWLDLATPNTATNDISVLLNTGDGRFEEERYYRVGNHPRAVIGADLDGDGDIDLVVANASDGTVTLLRNQTQIAPPPNQ